MRKPICGIRGGAQMKCGRILRYMEGTMCVWQWHGTHLQDSVFREVCTVDCVFHFVFAIKSTQCGGTQMPGNFLLSENILTVNPALMRSNCVRLSLTNNDKSCADEKFEMEHPVLLRVPKTQWLLSNWPCDPLQEVRKHTLNGRIDYFCFLLTFLNGRNIHSLSLLL